MGKNRKKQKNEFKKFWSKNVKLWTPTDFEVFELEYPKYIYSDPILKGYIVYKFEPNLLITFGDKWIKEAKVVFWRPTVTYDLDGKKKSLPPTR